MKKKTGNIEKERVCIYPPYLFPLFIHKIDFVNKICIGLQKFNHGTKHITTQIFHFLIHLPTIIPILIAYFSSNVLQKQKKALSEKSGDRGKEND